MKKKYIMFALQFLTILMTLVYGLTIFNKLPDLIATHFSFGGNSENFIPKNVVVWLIPLVFVLIEIAMILTVKFQREPSKSKNFDALVFWLIPILCVLVTEILYNNALVGEVAEGELKTLISVNKSVFTITGFVLVIFGCFFSSLNKSDDEKWILPFGITSWGIIIGGAVMMVFAMFDLAVGCYISIAIPCLTALISFLYYGLKK